MQTRNISAIKLIFSMLFADSAEKVYGFLGEYSTLIRKSGYPAINVGVEYAHYRQASAKSA
jgi:hypothetical protein